MALEEYVGAIIVEFNAVEYEAISLDVDVKGDKKLVKTMNRKRRAKGRVLLIPEYTLKVTLPIPAEGEPDWLAFDDGKVTTQSVEGGTRETFQGCFVTDMSAAYKVDSEAVRTLTLGALNRIVE
jgi:hypothetical protein